MRLLFTLFFLFFVLNVSAQFFGHWSYNFETLPNQYSPRFFIDTSYHNNIWQIGKPHKAVFDSAQSYPNAIVTDTLNPYPVNDTSVFVMKAIYYIPNGPTQQWYASEQFTFGYKLDIDSGEIARVELSLDSSHWMNCLDSAYKFSWISKPDFSKSTNGWKPFNLDFLNWNNPLSHVDSPYIYVKFTFISDGNQTNKDGWMIDNFNYDYWTEGIEKLQNNNLISIYPNPSSGNIYIRQNTSTYSKPLISISNLQGVEVYKTDKIPANGYLHLSLLDGVYMLKYLLGEEYAVKRLIIKN
jgi:hypothetical protein